MTDKEKLDAIRAEIHRLVDVRGYDREMANDLFTFMDSLEEDELTKDEQKVSNAYCRKIRDKRVLPILKGESKHKFINEFNTLYQTLDMQLCDRCMKEPLKDLCLAFAIWGAYNLKHIGGISKEEITKMDSLPNEPVSIWHDASEKSNEPEEVVIIKPSDNTGEVLTRCTGVYQGRIWAYTSELLKLDNPCKIGKNLQEEPVSEDLEETIKNIKLLTSNTALLTFEYGFRIGAKWGKNQAKVEIQVQSMALPHGCPEESVSEKLEEAVNAYIGYAPEIDESSSVYGKRQAFKAGAEWQKSQGVTEEAVIGITPKEYFISISQSTVDMLDLCAGDKVIVQLRKKEDKI